MVKRGLSVCGSDSQAVSCMLTVLVRDVVDSGTGLEAAVLVGHLPRRVSADSDFPCQEVEDN